MPSALAALQPATGEVALRVRVARDEALRAGGVADLVGLSQTGDRLARELALRGLGRIGSPDALSAIDAALGDRDPAIVSAALAARGVAAMLDDDPLAPADATARSAKLAAAMQRCGSACELAGIEALGRAGAAADRAVLDDALPQSPPSTSGEAAVRRATGEAAVRRATAAAIALGVHRRRGIDWLAEEQTLADGSEQPSGELRYAIAWALATGHAKSKNAQDALVEDLPLDEAHDVTPAISAAALKGLQLDGIDGKAAEVRAASALDNPDWRVQVEAVRVLAGEHGTDDSRGALAAQLAELADRAIAHDGVATQVLALALRSLAEHPARGSVGDLVAVADALAQPAAQKLAPVSRRWLRALAGEARIRALGQSSVPALGEPDFSDRLWLGLAADLAVHDPIAWQRTLAHTLLSYRDRARRGLAFGLFAALWPTGDASERQEIVTVMSSALTRGDLALASTAADAAGDLYASMGSAAPERAPLDAAVLARAASERDPELAAELVELLGKAHLAGAADACRAQLAGAPIVALAAVHCLRLLGERADPPAIGAATPPPVDVAAVIGHRVRWHLETTRGNIDIELLPDVAPWNVATIAALTARHFYDGTEIHRVVPDFVVQGGDPTASGAGGPGFTTPAEPASLLDGAGFVRGAVGMADAGRDSAGSQWFITHTRTPHLDGRYTWVGYVVSGQDIADSLLIGDRVLQATIEIVRK